MKFSECWWDGDDSFTMWTTVSSSTFDIAATTRLRGWVSEYLTGRLYISDNIVSQYMCSGFRNHILNPLHGVLGAQLQMFFLFCPICFTFWHCWDSEDGTNRHDIIKTQRGHFSLHRISDTAMGRVDSRSKGLWHWVFSGPTWKKVSIPDWKGWAKFWTS